MKFEFYIGTFIILNSILKNIVLQNIKLKMCKNYYNDKNCKKIFFCNDIKL